MKLFKQNSSFIQSVTENSKYFYSVGKALRSLQKKQTGNSDVTKCTWKQTGVRYVWPIYAAKHARKQELGGQHTLLKMHM